MAVKHLSLDIWGTLFKSNPNYSKVRARRLFLEVVGLEPTEDDIMRICNAYDAMMSVINKREQATKTTIPMHLKHKGVLSILGYPENVFNSHFYQTEIMQGIFIRNRPYLVHPEIPQFVTEFEDRHNTCTLIISNTGYIGGYVLREVLESYKFSTRTMKYYFTDENRWCKPCILPFKQMYVKSGIDAEYVMHIGDSESMDIIPATMAGAQAYKIENEDSWSHLFKSLS